MKYLSMIFLLGGLTLGAAAQASLNYGLASEVVRGMISDDVGRQILSDASLLSRYRGLGLEQELAQASVRRGLAERIDVQQQLQVSRRNILIQALRDDVVRVVAPPTEQEISKAYKQLSDQLVMAEAMKLDVYSIAATETKQLPGAHALLRKDSGPDASKALVEKGFNHITAQIAEPWFNANQVAAPVWEQLLEMDKDEVKNFPDGANTLLIRKLDHRESRQLGLDESRGLISNHIRRERQNRLWTAYLEKTIKDLGL